jgi:hypothetical protein
MRLAFAALLTVTTLALGVTAPALAQYTIWMGPLDLVSGDASTTVGLGIPNTAARVTFSATGTSRWAVISLEIPSNVLLNSIDVCYENSDATGAFITTTRLTRMLTPDGATVIIDDTNDRIFDVGCYRVEYYGQTVSSAFTLAFRFDVSDVGDYVEIGSIALNVTPTATAAPAPGQETAPSVDLEQNHPNPFNPSTTIEYDVQTAGWTTARIYNAAGELVRTLIDEGMEQGSYSVVWDGRDDDGRDLASGVYFYRVSVGDFVSTKRMVMLR